MLLYRGLHKLKGTYVDGTGGKKQGILGLLDENDRVHTQFKIAGTVTGRLASAEPNLQNIPKRVGPVIRRLFTAGPRRRLVYADYERAELFAALLYSHDPVLAEALKGDIHRTTAASIFGIREEDVTDNQRWVAKCVVFGVIYGRGARSLTDDLHCPIHKAQEYLEAFFAMYSVLAKWLWSVRSFASSYGYVRNAYGRRRHLYAISDSDNKTRAEMLRQAMNFPCQSTVADRVYEAMVSLFDLFTINEWDAHIVCQIHDALLIDCEEDIAEEVAFRTAEIMNTPSKYVPSFTLHTEPKIYSDWGEELEED